MNSMKPLLALAHRSAALTLLLAASGCGGGGGGGGPPSIASIAVSAANATPQAGTTEQLTATATYSDRSTGDVTGQANWSSSDSTVATVGNVGGTKGIVTASAAGAATITATAGGISGDTALTVTPAPDFAVSLSPTAISTALGTTSPPVSIALTAASAVTENATLTLEGLPAGVTREPSGPLIVSSAQPLALTLSASATAAIGVYSVQVSASIGSTSHAATLTLTVNPVVITSEDSTMIYIEAHTAKDVARIGLYKTWGAAITEARLNGVNYVNHDDPGRQIQTSLWDGNVNYTTTGGYNPVESGDHDFNGSPVLASAVQADAIYTKIQPLQWAPELFGGGSSPVVGDAYMEKWVSVIPGSNRAFRIHYRITHFGTDSHAVAPQELPVMYVNPIAASFIYYSGNTPWTNGALSQLAMPNGCCATVSTAERWGAYVDATNTGIALYTPMQYPNGKGFNAGSTLQFTPLCPMSWGPGSVLEFDTYVLLGPVSESRQTIYTLHAQSVDQSPLPPYGYGGPASGTTLSGSAAVSGWAWALSGISSIDVFVDGHRVGSATYGFPRPDVVSALPGAPGDTGFQYALDTTKIANGAHAIFITATDILGHVATFATSQVTISN